MKAIVSRSGSAFSTCRAIEDSLSRGRVTAPRCAQRPTPSSTNSWGFSESVSSSSSRPLGEKQIPRSLSRPRDDRDVITSEARDLLLALFQRQQSLDDARGHEEIVTDRGDLFCFFPPRLERLQLTFERAAF